MPHLKHDRALRHNYFSPWGGLGRFLKCSIRPILGRVGRGLSADPFDSMVLRRGDPWAAGTTGQKYTKRTCRSKPGYMRVNRTPWWINTPYHTPPKSLLPLGKYIQVAHLFRSLAHDRTHGPTGPISTNGPCSTRLNRLRDVVLRCQCCPVPPLANTSLYQIISFVSFLQSLLRGSFESVLLIMKEPRLT